MKQLLHNARLAGQKECCSVLIDGPYIEEVGSIPSHENCKVTDLQGRLLLAGVIDTHVHFREPGLTHKATIATESRAALAGGVTSVLEMPNCNPQTTTLAALHDKQERAAQSCACNYAFFIGATSDNADLLRRIDYTHVPGIKVFMGSSTGGMLLDKAESLRQVFSLSPSLPIVTHCEQTDIIVANAARIGDSHDMREHANVRSREACIESTRLALALAEECGTRLHVAHISTKEELALFGKTEQITAEVCMPHLLFCDDDYDRLGARIKCNPAVKKAADREALRQALRSGQATTIATDHAPHLLSEKQTGGCLTAPSGMPMVQFSLLAALELVREGVLSEQRMTELMSAAPARVFGIEKRGEVRAGYYADLVCIEDCAPWTVQDSHAISLCHWTPLAGREMHHRIAQVWINGKAVFTPTQHIAHSQGSELTFTLCEKK